jgi:alpha-ketoglutarate-dependent taurine dioxygenase
MGRSWQSTLRASTREAAEKRLRQLNYSWEWLPDGSLRATTPVLPAVRPLSGGRKSFFNQLIAAAKGWKDTRNDPSKAITFGDGSALDRNAVNIAAELGDELSFDIPWQNGDVALVDNFVAMHGRRTFTGTRRVLASLVATD